MKVSILLTSIVLVVSSIASSSAREKEEEGNPTSPTICSCSPTEFEFVLNLDQECTIVTKYRESINGVRQQQQQQQGNDIFESNPGLAGSFCTVDQNVVVPTATSEGDEDEDDAEDEPLRRRSLQGQRTYTPTYSSTSEVVGQGGEDIPTPVLVGDEDGEEEEEDDDDPVIEVVSIQFLEFDTSDDLTVINQDNTYANVSLASGKRIKFTSVSSFLDTTMPIDSQMDSPSLVPGGASLILYGKTESGRVVRNRFFWSYTMDCENVPVTVGNKLGWVEVTEVSNAWPVFCPALPPDSPTITPRTIEPTMTPTNMPNGLYQDTTKSPTVSDSSTGPDSKGSKSIDSKASKPAGYYHSHIHDHELEREYFWSKSGKGSKSHDYYEYDRYHYDHYHHDHYHFHYYEPESSHASSMSMSVSMSMDAEEEKSTEPKKVYFKSKSGKGSKGNGYGKSSKGRGNRAHNMESEETAESEESTEAGSSSTTPGPSSSPVPTTTGTSETGQIDSTIAIREPKSSSSLRVVDSNEERNLVVPLVVSAAAMAFIMIGLVYRRKLVRSQRDGGL